MSESNSSYPFVVTKVRALEARLITKEKLERIIDAKDFKDAMRVLCELGYGQPAAADATFEQLIQKELMEADKFLESVSPNDLFTSIMRAEKDYLNLKVLVKLQLLNRSLDDIALFPGNIAVDKLKRAIAENNYNELPSPMKAALKFIDKQFLSNADVSVVGIALDRAYAREIVAFSDKLNDPLIGEYLKAYFDLSNILAFMRIKISGNSKEAFANAYLHGGSTSLRKFSEAFDSSDDSVLNAVVKIDYARFMADAIEEYHSTKNLYLLEKLRDDYLFELAKEKRNDIFSLGPLMFYYISKQREAAAVRMVMTAKQGGIEEHIMKKRLRELF